MATLSSFDLDFGYGRQGETLVEELLTGGKTVEVKRDRRWVETGNLYIETGCYFTKIDDWAPSGLFVTEAAYWAFVIQDSIFIVPTETLKEVVAKYGRRITCKIEPNISNGYLIKVEDLINGTREHK